MSTIKAKKTVKTAAPKKADGAKKAAVRNLIKQTSPATSKLLLIDYPAEGEKVSCGHYSFRIGSPEKIDNVKLSVNGGAWLDCRHSHGYWWYDCHGFEAGPCAAQACAVMNGKEVKSAKRKFKAGA